MVLQSSLSSMPHSAQKKQKSISSFFTARPATLSKNETIPVSDPSANWPEALIEHGEESLFVEDDRSRAIGNSQRIAGLKRSSTERSGDDADDSRPRKRRRSPSVSLNADGRSASPHIGVAIDSVRTAKLKATDRTSKYMFSSSPALVPAQGGNVDDEDDADEVRRNKERLHRSFVKKLGKGASIAELKRRNTGREDNPDDEDLDEEGANEADDEPEERSRPAGKSGRAAKSSKGKITPLQREIIGLKRAHPDVLLIVEVGYKYQIYGEDARKAAKELSIVCIPGRFNLIEPFDENQSIRFASASFPTHRLQVHAKRLVLAGYKVGIVRQLETAALKAAGSTRNKLFQRGLTNLYTKGTYGIDDEESLDADLAGIGSTAPTTGHLLCLTESYPKGAGSDEKVQIGIIAVQPATGDIIYDDFEDGWMRAELETRLLHISPCEFLIVGHVSSATKKLIEHLSGGREARIEYIDKPKTMAAQAYSRITKFYADKMKGDEANPPQVESSQEVGTLLDKVHRLSENATICLSAMITHLTDYGLEHVFDLTKYFQSFSSRSHMLLNGNTLSSLEIYRNQSDQTEYGSLFWVLNRTQTRFGQRLLRKWVGRPLLDRARLDERIAAVEELRDPSKLGARERISELLQRVKADLERSVIRIYYKRCSRPELLAFLQTLQLIGQEYAGIKSPEDAGFRSSMISEAIASLPRILDDVVKYLERMQAEAAKKDDKYDFFREEYETEDITNHKIGIVAVEHDLNEFRAVAAEKLKFKKPVSYVTVAQIEYLIEVDKSQMKKVPASWIKINSTKAVSRYHAPEVLKWIRERDQHKEALANACDAAFLDLLSEIGGKYQEFRDCIQSLALLDCLLSLSKVAEQPGYCKPTFVDSDEAQISITQGRHPMVENLMRDAFVPNDVSLRSEQTRALLITGPNMGGKSSYVRSVALIAIMAQIGSYVPAAAVELGLLDAVFTRMGAGDNLMKGESTFMVELGETSDILKQGSPRSLVILDELGRGTSTHDGVAIAQAVLEHVVSEKKCLTLFITHYQTLARMQEAFPHGELKNVHMSFSENDGDVTFLYQVAAGVAHRSYGLNVAKLAGLPKTLIDEAGRRSKLMEREESRRKMKHLGGAVASLCVDGTQSQAEYLDLLVNGIEQL